MRIRDLLNALPPEERAEIARHHRLERTVEVDDLTRHLIQSRTLLNTLRNELKPVTDLVERLAAFGGEAPIGDDVIGSVTPQRLRGAHTKGLVLLLPSADAPDRVVLPLEYQLMREVKRPTMRDLIGGLRILTVDQARRAAELLELRARRNMPFALGDLHEALRSRAEAIGRALTPEARTALDAVIQKGGAADAGDHHRQFPLVADTTARGPFHVADLFGSGRFRGRPTPTQTLVQRGLLFAATERDQPGGVIEQLFVAHEVLEPLSAVHAGRRDAARTRTLERFGLTVDTPTDPAPSDLRAELRAFVLAAASRGYRIARSGSARRDDADAIQSWREGLTPKAQDTLAELALRLGVLRSDGAHLRPTADAARILDAPATTFASDVRDAIIREAGEADPIPARVRRLALTALERVPDRWLALDGLHALLEDENEYRQLRSVHDIDENRLRTLVEDALTSLRAWGTVDLTHTPAPGCRFRGLDVPDYPDVPARCLTIPPNLDVMAPLIAPIDLLLALGQFAEPIRYDHAAMFRLTPGSLLRGADRGYPAAEVPAFLAAHCAHDLPAEVVQLVRDATEREGEVRLVRTSAIVIVSDDSLAAAIREHPALRDARATEIAPGVHALPEDADVRAVHGALREAGVFATLAERERDA